MNTCPLVLNHECIAEHESLYELQDSNHILILVIQKVFATVRKRDDLLEVYRKPQIFQVDCIPEFPIICGFKCLHCSFSDPINQALVLHVMASHVGVSPEISIANCFLQNPFGEWIRVKSEQITLEGLNNDSDGFLIRKMKNEIKKRSNLSVAVQQSMVENSAINARYDDTLIDSLTPTQIATLEKYQLAAISHLGVFICKECHEVMIRLSKITSHECHSESSATMYTSIIIL